MIYFKINIPILEWLQNFWTGYWSDDLEKIPLKISYNNYEVNYYIKKDERPVNNYIDISPIQYMIITINETDILYNELLKSIISIETWKKLYSIYEKIIKKVSLLFYKVWNFEYLNYRTWYVWSFLSNNHFLISDGYKLELSINGIDYKKVMFEEIKKIPKNKNTRNPMYSDEALLTKEKWEKMQKKSDIDILEQENILKLLKLKSRVLLWDRFSLLEASIILEILFWNITKNKFNEIWISNKKIKDLELELTFNLILNTYLPLILNKINYSKYKDDLNNINTLRWIRNNIVHKNLTKIDKDLWVKWINSGIKLYEFLITN